MNDISGKVFDKKYPISKNNRQCIGPCYEPKTWIIHPVTLEYVTNPDQPFCPVNEWEWTDPKTGAKKVHHTDTCYVPTHEKDSSQKDIEMNILIPKIDFSCVHFLKIYYDIHSFEDSLQYITTTTKSPIYTRLRVMECSLEAFGSQIDTIDERLITFYTDVIKKLWISNIYQSIKDYIHINNKSEIYFGPPTKTKQDTDTVPKINFLVSTFITPNNMYKFFQRYIERNKSEWTNIKSHNQEIKLYFKKYILEKITETIR